MRFPRAREHLGPAAQLSYRLHPSSFSSHIIYGKLDTTEYKKAPLDSFPVCKPLKRAASKVAPR
ncbi:hypothetical protein J6590_016455 [Homalodisca vitripennis]|nr:hypothetical protein J6590_016455 [Homalodisca vitripennis]